MSNTEIAIRVVNIIFALSLIKEYVRKHHYCNECISEIIKFLYACGEHLEQALQKDVKSVYDFFAINALIILGVFLGDLFGEAKVWQNAGMSKLSGSLPAWIYSEGVEKEASLYMHTNLLESVFYTIYY